MRTMQVRLFTLEEANALLPTLQIRYEDVRRIVEELRELRDNLVDLRIVWGDALDDPSCDGNAEYQDYKDRFHATEKDMQRVLSQVSELGCEVKDLENGLIDFNARRGDEVVFLCWKAGEDEIVGWHTHDAGYAARRPIKEF
jgi:hypothetical protein